MNTEDFVERALGSLGLQVRHLEVGATKTPDLLVSDRTCNYFIEVKDKFPDPSMMRRRAEVLDGGGVWEEEKALAYDNAISKVIREGSAQLSALRVQPTDFRMLWLHARHRHRHTRLTQFEATLYGSVDLIDLDEIADSVPARPCYFFNFAEFFTLRHVLDGAFVSTDQCGVLCLNSLSERFESLRSSRLCQVFPGIRDPIDLERAGTAYIADCDASRRDRAAVLHYVKEKYGRPRLIEFRPKHYSAEMVAPRPLDDTV